MTGGTATHDHVAFRQQMQLKLKNFKINKPRPDVHRDLERGWMIPIMLHFDAMYYGRWEYWMDLVCTRALPERPIPPLDFEASPDPHTRKMLTTCLDAIPDRGIDSWQSWSSYDYFRYFLNWLLWGFGHAGQKEAPKEPMGCEGASDRLYQIFNLGLVLLWPYDYLGELLAENKHGRHNGFYPTPHSLVDLMVRLTMQTPEQAGQDLRLQSVMDPCVGTGRFLLHASNHSLLLFGQDIDDTMCQTTLVNGYFYAPWLVKPVGDLPPADAFETALPHEILASEDQSASREPLGTVAPVELAAEVEEPYQFAPIFKGKKKNNANARQGLLF